MQRSDRNRTNLYPRSERATRTSYDDGRPLERPRRLENQTTRRMLEYNLSITPTEAVHALRELGQAVKWPVKLKTWEEQRDKSKFCEFRNDHGHRTDECIALRLEVANLLARGHLSELLTNKGKETWRQGDRDTNNTDLPPPAPPRIDKTLHCITGGSEVSGVSLAAAKKSSWAARHQHLGRPRHIDKNPTVLSFSNSEASDLIHHHHDALIVTLTVQSV